MGSMNRVFLMGRLTRDPELKETAGGTAVSRLGLATNSAYKRPDGELVETVCFTDIEVWGRQAENCSQYLHKGSPILVEGKLKLDRWETPDGQARSKLRVTANRVQFLGRPRGGNGDDAGVPVGAGVTGEDDALPF